MTSAGEEATAVGSAAALTLDDIVSLSAAQQLIFGCKPQV